MLLVGLTPSLPATAGTGNASINLTETLGAPTIAPVLKLTLAVDKSAAIPGDTLTYSSTVTNTGATLAFSGTDFAQNNGNIAATVSAYYDDVEYYSTASKGWVALAEIRRLGFQPDLLQSGQVGNLTYEGRIWVESRAGEFPPRQPLVPESEK